MCMYILISLSLSIAFSKSSAKLRASENNRATRWTGVSAAKGINKLLHFSHPCAL